MRSPFILAALARARASRLILVVCAPALLAACASTASLHSAVDAPRFAVGDQWRYRVIDNLSPLNRTADTLDREVLSVKDGVARMRVIYTDARGPHEHVEELVAAGTVRVGTLRSGTLREFRPPVRELAFPLTQGESWRQAVETLRSPGGTQGEILLYGRVIGTTPVTVPAGAYDAVVVYRIVQLDDEEFWRHRTERRDQVWYSPQVRGVVKEIHDAEYREKGNGMDTGAVRTENRTYELVSFRPGAG